jgi:hypothetical protein
VTLNRGPIFIGGPDRCGKTTLQAFLSSHPNIAIPVVGSNFWTYFYGQYGDLSQPENFEHCLDALLHYKHALFLKPDPDRLRKEFWQGEPGYARLFALIHEHYAEREGKPRWGDQTGLVERYTDQIFSAYPEAKLIHMIRDPRDRYEASLALWPNGRARVGGATARWLYSIAWARRNMKRYPDRYKFVLFETLVHRPEETLREICAFLGEEYDPEMLTMDASPGHREKLRLGVTSHPAMASHPATVSPPAAASSSATTPLSPDFIGRYRGVISKPDIAFMQTFAKGQMMRYGYGLDSLKFSTGERFHYVTKDLPTNLLRMATWLGQELLQHRFPGYWGRKPGAHMIVKANGREKIREEAA